MQDCLYLNIWRPRRVAGGAPLPVMVWVHGGGMMGGSGASFNASRLAATQGVLVVTLNYRLGPLGFLSHPVKVLPAKRPPPQPQGPTGAAERPQRFPP